ncbi:transporter substrate-binding domain-containing protein [Roseibium denhamense]|uniref:Amino acid ABC transporter substrate-binding protein, PAAT family n=1 Tax=Roseibium denhamense TaxID=76305 RepID=A0ABY1P4E7_9HYPH|nr:transporter substrate-binding domain-containing protein [Roseibium denhamense]MTI07272.1 transporter substrate-binding domain-containing protein [Roseibium denhamense]SMP26180.1 amino acid ABC transporter substrate-binding protein, PAAT family [Roseibium denhamense]
MVATINPATAQSAPVTVPNFWDPKAVHDRPASIPDKIQFLATDGYPPFVFRDPEGRLTGFNVDLARALCEELGSSCALKIKDFEVLLPALDEEEGDAIIAGLSRSSPGAGELNYTEDYLKLPARFVVQTDAASRFDEQDLEGVSISIERGSRYEAFAKKFWPQAEIIPAETAQEARALVRSGDADAHFGDGLNLSFWLRSEAANGCCSFAGGPWLEPGHFDEGMAIATRPDDPERATALNYALRQIHTKGVFKELYLRYFPMSFY